MTNASKEQWLPCSDPQISDTIRWREPLWDVPSKVRGKRDKIGEQLVTAKLLTFNEPVELQVIEVKQLSLIDGAPNVLSKIKKNDIIRRKPSSILAGGCEKLTEGE